MKSAELPGDGRQSQLHSELRLRRVRCIRPKSAADPADECHLRAEPRESFDIIIHVIHEYREPCSRMALSIEAKEQFDFAQANAAEIRRVAPFKNPFEEQFLQVIIHRLREIPDVENWRQALRRYFRSIAHK